MAALAKLQKCVNKVALVNKMKSAKPEVGDDSSIKVCVRVRPFIKEELEGSRSGGQTQLCIAMPTTTTVVMDRGGSERDSRTFEYDRCYWSHSPDHPLYATQETLMEELGENMLTNAVNGFNNCMFAYGQTGSGKSFSVLGGPGDARGLLPRVVEGLFAHIASADSEMTCKTSVSFIEIYNEQIRDLLAPAEAEQKKLDVKQHPVLGMIIPGLTEAAVTTCDEVLKLVEYGSSMRHTSATAMNATSSRSHCVFTFKTAFTTTGGNAMLSQTHLVDLAGSERAGRTQASGDRLKEGAAINQSLSTLARVISTLAAKAAKGSNMPVPFRDSKLTFVLKESLCGNSKTVMMAAISPNGIDYDETMGTMKFAESVKKVQTKAVNNTVNEKGVEAQLRAELEELRGTLAKYESGDQPTSDRHKEMERRIEEQEQLCKWFGQDWDQLIAEESNRMKKREAQLHLGDSLATFQERLSTMEPNSDAESFGESESDLEDEEETKMLAHCALFHLKTRDQIHIENGGARCSIVVPIVSSVAVTGPAAMTMTSTAPEITNKLLALQADAAALQEQLSGSSAPDAPSVRLCAGVFVDPETRQAHLVVRATRLLVGADAGTDREVVDWLSEDEVAERTKWLKAQSSDATLERAVASSGGDAWVASHAATGRPPRELLAEAEGQLARLREQSSEELAGLRAQHAEEAKRAGDEVARLSKELEDAAKSADERVARLQAEVSSRSREALMRRSADTKKANADMEALRAELEAAKQQADGQVAQLRAESAEANTRATESSAELARLAAEAEKASDDLACLRAELEATKRNAEAQVSQLRAESGEAGARASEELARHAAEAQHANDDVARLRAELDSKTREADELVAQLRAESAEANTRATGSREETERHLAEARTANDDVARLRAELEASRQQADEQVAQLRAESDEANTRATGSREETARHAAEAQNANDEVARLRAELEDSRQKADEQVAQLRAESDEANTRATGSREETARHAAEAKSANDEVARLRAELEATRHGADEQVAQLRAESADANTRATASAEEVARHEAEAKRANDDVARLSAELEDRMQEANGQVVQLREKSAQANVRASQAGEEVARHAAEAKRANDDVARLHAELEATRLKADEQVAQLRAESVAANTRATESSREMERHAAEAKSANDDVARLKKELEATSENAVEQVAQLREESAAASARAAEASKEMERHAADAKRANDDVARLLVELEDKMRDADEQVAQLRRESAEASMRATESSEEVARHAAEARDANDDVARLRAELEAARQKADEEMAHLRAESADAHARVTEASKDLARHAVEAKYANDGVARLRAELEVTRQKADDAVAQLRAESAATKTRATEASTEMARYAAEAKLANDDVERLRAELEATRQKADDQAVQLRGETVEANARETASREEAARHAAEAKYANDDVSRLRAELWAMRQKANEQVAQLQAEFAETVTQALAASETIARHAAEARNTNADHERLRAELNADVARLRAGLEATKDNALEQVAQLQAAFAEATTASSDELARHAVEAREVNGELARLRTEVEAARREADVHIAEDEAAAQKEIGLMREQLRICEAQAAEGEFCIKMQRDADRQLRTQLNSALTRSLDRDKIAEQLAAATEDNRLLRMKLKAAERGSIAVHHAHLARPSCLPVFQRPDCVEPGQKQQRAHAAALKIKESFDKSLDAISQVQASLERANVFSCANHARNVARRLQSHMEEEEAREQRDATPKDVRQEGQ